MVFNYTCIFQGVKNTCKIMKKVGRTKEWAMPSLRGKGKHDQLAKIKQYPSLAPNMHLNSNPNEAQTLIPHFITT